MQVLPYCPFIRGWIAKHPAYVDMVPESERARFDLPGGGSGTTACAPG